jgi:hypothetical protein
MLADRFLVWRWTGSGRPCPLTRRYCIYSREVDAWPIELNVLQSDLTADVRPLVVVELVSTLSTWEARVRFIVPEALFEQWQHVESAKDDKPSWCRTYDVGGFSHLANLLSAAHLMWENSQPRNCRLIFLDACRSNYPNSVLGQHGSPSRFRARWWTAPVASRLEVRIQCEAGRQRTNLSDYPQ